MQLGIVQGIRLNRCLDGLNGLLVLGKKVTDGRTIVTGRHRIDGRHVAGFGCERFGGCHGDNSLETMREEKVEGGFYDPKIIAFESILSGLYYSAMGFLSAISIADNIREVVTNETRRLALIEIFVVATRQDCGFSFLR